MQIRRQMTGIYHPCSTFTSQSAHFCDIFSKCKFEQIHFIAQCRISCNLGPDSAVGEKGKKRAQIGKYRQAKGAKWYPGEVEREAKRGDSLWCLRSMIPDFGIMLWLVKCLHVDRFAVLLTVSCTFNITRIQFGKDFLKHGFRERNTNSFARLFAYPSAPRRAKNMPVIKEKEAFKIWSFSYTPLWQSTITFTKRLTYKPTFKRYSIVTTPKEANTWSIYLFKLATMLLHVWKKQYFQVLSSMSICHGSLTFLAFLEKHQNL